MKSSHQVDATPHLGRREDQGEVVALLQLIAQGRIQIAHGHFTSAADVFAHIEEIDKNAAE